MKISVFVASVLMFAATTAPSFALQGGAVSSLPSQAAKASCDIRNEDEQAVCASNCDDKYIRGKQHNMTNQAANDAEKKACDAKCGCPQNTK